MPRLLRFALPLALPLSLLAQAPAEHQPKYSPVKSMSQEDFDKQLSNSPHFDFEFAAPDGLVDAQGTHIRASDLMAYLRERQLDPKAFFIISLTSASPSTKTASTTIDPLGRYGATKIVFKQKPGRVPSPILAEFHPAPGTPHDDKKVAVIRIKPNANSLVAGQAFPPLAGRPAELRPEALPPRVRYAFASDETMIAAAHQVAAALLSTQPVSNDLFGKDLTLQAGLWSQLKDTAGLGKTAATPWNSVVAVAKGITIKTEGMTLKDSTELATLQTVLSKLIADNGGGELHAGTAAEMARWWPFVSADYVEPVFFLRTKNGAHTFALQFEAGHLSLIDDLSGLPTTK